MISPRHQPRISPTARGHARFVRPAAVVGTALAMTFLVAGRASAAPTTKIKTQITNRTLVVTGSNAIDVISLRVRAGDPATLEVVDVAKAVVIGVNRGDFENIRVTAAAGNDTVTIDDSGGVFTETEVTTIDGGIGNDTLIGGSGSERFLGGPGNDVVTGGRGNDLALLDEGNDTFVWNPGDGSDTVAFNALGGADTVNVHNLTGTDTKTVAIDLANPPASGTGDAAADHVIVSGTNGNDNVRVTSTGGVAKVGGLVPTVTIAGAEAANDRLDVNTFTGVDKVVTHLGANDIQLFVNGNPM